MSQVTDFIDLSDHDAFVEAVPHEAFAALRERDPVHWNPEADGPGFWAVTRSSRQGVTGRRWVRGCWKRRCVGPRGRVLRA